MSERIEKFLKRLADGEMLLADGSWSTQMQRLGLQPGECPEEWNVTRPGFIEEIARSYFAAGAEMVLTNTFGGTRFRLMRHGFAGKAREFNLAGAALCRRVAEEHGGFVAASVGPTGEFLEPEGLLKEQELYGAFLEQLAALKDGGADAVCIETMYVLNEALLAVKAARELNLFCMASMAFEASPKGFRTLSGADVKEVVSALEEAGADVVGANCGNNMAGMIRLAGRLRLFTQKPLLIRPNAGTPHEDGKKISYHDTPETMAAGIAPLKAAGVNIVGGCCGTTPEHIRAFRGAIDHLEKR
jgi:5-methyltetrahydrofolate--homocysteine methyltransferase